MSTLCLHVFAFMNCFHLETTRCFYESSLEAKSALFLFFVFWLCVSRLAKDVCLYHFSWRKCHRVKGDSASGHNLMTRTHSLAHSLTPVCVNFSLWDPNSDSDSWTSGPIKAHQQLTAASDAPLAQKHVVEYSSKSQSSMLFKNIHSHCNIIELILFGAKESNFHKTH